VSKLRNRYGFGLLVVLALGVWAIQQMQERADQQVVQQGRSPEYFVENLKLTSLDKAGIPRRVLRARRVMHYDDDGTTELEQPHLTVYDPQKPPWQISSAGGWVSAQGDLVLLEGDVVIVRQEGPGNRPLRILTESLRVRPNDDYAETDQFVQVFSRNDWLESEGAKVWLAQPVRIKFLSKVRGRYEVN